ncbi:MAG: ATP-binding protein [Deltaproteobacteria bacterium]|nr:ATP-binding protein [Deltaproteobacteria bacterium]
MTTTPRFFNTAGPCDPVRHYGIDPLARFPEAIALIDWQGCFVLHAPRQTGKTPTLRALAKALTEEGRFAAPLFSCEAGEAVSDDVGEVEGALLRQIAMTAEDDLPEALRPPPVVSAPVGVQLSSNLRAWCRSCPKPVVLFFDEIDALRDDGLRTVLRQLRASYATRAPHAVILCGLRDVRDYRMASGGKGRLGTSSPFNINVASTRMPSFTEAQVRELLVQHTEATGQPFSEGALERVFYYTQGQPWLTNALAAEVVDHLGVTGEITAAHIDRAKENLVLARAEGRGARFELVDGSIASEIAPHPVIPRV